MSCWSGQFVIDHPGDTNACAGRRRL